MNDINNENQVETEELIVDVEDTPINEEAVVETDSGGDDELDKYTKGVSKRINKLNDKIREAEMRANEAESRYKNLSSEYATVKSRASVLDKSYTEEYENRVKSQRQQAEDLYRKARETNDPDLEVKSVELLNKVSLEEERVRLAKVQLQSQEEQSFRNQPQSVQNTQQPVYDKPKPDSKAVEWQKENDWFQQDRVKTYTAMGIHEDLINEGFDGHDNEYYEELDRRLKDAFPQKFGQAKARSQQTSPVAGVTRGSNKRTIKLTQAQLDVCKRLGVSPKDYARYVE